MKADKNERCSVCGKTDAKTECDHCGAPLCRDCCKLEIWGSGAEDLSARYFCPACKEDPAVNPWGAHYNVPDTEDGRKPVARKAKSVIVRTAGAKHISDKKENKRQAG
ncbi:MAG: hypothetical protein EPN93_16115 [Spirochaetes bacterium]|nr:MAG: hypothetical protein EPN93_16115 [Spirochaetota bacterium]